MRCILCRWCSRYSAATCSDLLRGVGAEADGELSSVVCSPVSRSVKGVALSSLDAKVVGSVDCHLRGARTVDL
jgi:hypothetical protein